jgi:hypothetical protein
MVAFLVGDEVIFTGDTLFRMPSAATSELVRAR